MLFELIRSFLLSSLIFTTFPKSGKLSDYTPYFTKGTPVQFWWDNEQGWLHATCLNDITRNLSRGIIRWIVKMKFKEDDEIFSYAFLPKDNRWKIKIENNESEEAKSKVPKKQKAVAKKSKDDKSSNKEEKAPFTIATDSDIEDDVVLSQLKPSSKSKSTPKLKAPTKQKGAVKKSKDDKSSNKEEKAPFTIATDSDMEDDVVLSQLKPSSKSKSTPKLKAPTKQKGAVKKSKDDKSINKKEKCAFTIATDSDMEDDVVLSQLKPSSKSKSTPKLKAPTKQKGVGKEAKDDQSSNKKEKCAFTIATESDMEDDVVLSQLKPSSKSKSTQNTKRDALKKEKALPSVTPVAKNDATKKTFLKTVDLCYGGAKNAKSTAATGGDAIFVTKPKPASISFQYNSVGSYSAAAAANSAATSKLMGQKKNETIPACKFHKSTAKMSNPFQTTHHPSAAAKSYPFSARAEDTIKMATSKAMKSSRDAAYAATKPAKPKTIGCLTVMDGLNRPTQLVKPRATIPKEKTMTEKIYNKAHEEAKSFMAGMMDKNPHEEKAERPFSTSSDEEEELDVKIGRE
jgi:hypothetical protein